MVTSTLELNNSVCLNPRGSAETALQKSSQQDFQLTLMEQNFRCCTYPNRPFTEGDSDSYWHHAFGQMCVFSCEWSVLLTPRSCLALSSSVIGNQNLLWNMHNTAHPHFYPLFQMTHSWEISTCVKFNKCDNLSDPLLGEIRVSVY